MTTEEEIRRELKGLVPVVIHWYDAWHVDGKTSAKPKGKLEKLPRLSIGFARYGKDGIVDIFRDATLDPAGGVSHDDPAQIVGVRAITYLEPTRTDLFKTTVRKVRTVKHAKTKARRKK